MKGLTIMALIGKTVKLANSSGSVEIVKADNNNIYVDFGSGKPIPISYDKCESLLILDSETKEEILAESKIHHQAERTTKSPAAIKEGTENIAFKITYCDGGETGVRYGFRGPCSARCREANQKAGRAWCNEDKYCLCAKLAKGIITQEEYNRNIGSTFFCYESTTLVDWKAYAGTDNAKNPPRPRRFNQLCSSGIALLTTVPNGETDRYIFGLFKIAKYYRGDEAHEGYLEAHPKYRIEFTKEESRQMRFWDFYSNKNSEKEQWGTGLFRYLSNEQILEVLKKTVEVKQGTKDYELAKELLEVFCKEKEISI